MKTVPSSMPYSQFAIPQRWREPCHAKIKGILALPRTRQAFAQIYDGIQTYYSATDMGDHYSIDGLQLSSIVSDKAEQDSEEWLMSVEQMIADAEIDVHSAEMALKILGSEAAEARKIGALILGSIKPVIRNLLGRCLLCSQSDGRRVQEGSFWQIHDRTKPAMETVQDWGEEYIFGGQLVQPRDKTKVRRRLINPNIRVCAGGDCCPTESGLSVY